MTPEGVVNTKLYELSRNPPKCLLCDKQAVTTAAHLPVCKNHWQLYQQEAKQYLPHSQRPIYQSLLRAEEKRNQK